MKKKGTTESYSFFIGIVIAFLMLTAIGCAVYNMYKPKSQDSFNKLVNKLKTLEKQGNEEGEYPLFLEEEWFVIGFDKTKDFEYKSDCPKLSVEYLGSLCGSEYLAHQSCPSDAWGCYGFGFSEPPGKKGQPTKILKPKTKCGDKGCLCLCKIDKINEEEPFLISEEACLRSDAVCASFDSLNFVGSEGCCYGVFIPGTYDKGVQIRGLKALKYKKSGNEISLSDLSQSDFAKRIKNVTAEEPVEESSKVSVVLSSSCGEENNEVKEGVKTQLRDNWELIPVEVKQKPEEGACLMPDTVAKEVEGYKNAEYFLQIETDKTIASENQVVVNSVEGNEWSLKLAEDIANELKADGFDVVKGFTNDPVMKLFMASQKAAVEVKMQKEDSKAIEPIAEAIAKNKKEAKASVCPLPATYDEWIKKYAEESKIPPSLLKALIKQESTFDPLAISESGCAGLLQFCYGTGEDYFGRGNVVLCCPVESGETIYTSCKNERKDRNLKWDENDMYLCNPQNDKRFDPETSIKAGAKFLHDLDSEYIKEITDPTERYKFDLAAYNVGSGCINYALSEYKKQNSGTPTWEKVSTYIPTTDRCPSRAKTVSRDYVAKITTYEKDYSTCFV